MVAIYVSDTARNCGLYSDVLWLQLEYFGRPLGLWRTSAKLAHTLLETVFICAWSAALSLCFDNFFTSSIPCAPWSRISWYNELPRPPSNLPTFEGSTGDHICDSQLALICLVFVGLLMYCISLVISLYRIFEKVKYYQGRRPSWSNLCTYISFWFFATYPHSFISLSIPPTIPYNPLAILTVCPFFVSVSSFPFFVFSSWTLSRWHYWLCLSYAAGNCVF